MRYKPLLFALLFLFPLVAAGQPDSASDHSVLLYLPHVPGAYIYSDQYSRTGGGGKDAIFTRTSYFTGQTLVVVIDARSRKVVGGTGLWVPPQFVHRVKVDSTNKHFAPKKDPLPDSISLIDYVALDSFYRAKGVHVDTLMVEDRKIIKGVNFQEISCAGVCGYRQEIRATATIPLKQGKETEYYSVAELKGKIVRANFRLKCKGSWEKGEKVGKWKYYSPEGYLVKIEKWKKGRLRKERVFTS